MAKEEEKAYEKSTLKKAETKTKPEVKEEKPLLLPDGTVA